MTVCLSGCRQLPSRGRHLFGQKEERTPKRPFRSLGICGGEYRTVPLNPTVRSCGNNSRIGPKVAHDARPAARAVVVEDRAVGRLDQVGQRPAVLVAADDGATVYWPVRLREGRDPPRQTPGPYRAASARPRSSSTGRARWLRTTRALEATSWSWSATVTRTPRPTWTARFQTLMDERASNSSAEPVSGEFVEPSTAHDQTPSYPAFQLPT